MKVHDNWIWAPVMVLAGVSGWAQDDSPASFVRGIEGGRVAVYASTNSPREAVAWLPSDTVFLVQGALKDDEPWVRVDPPDAVSVWLYRELVRDGRVLVDKSQVRAGAGPFFPPIASLDKGTRVETRGVYGDWLKIKPSSDIGFWVLHDQVEPLAALQNASDAESSSPDVFSDILDALTNETASLSFTNGVADRPDAESDGVGEVPFHASPPELTGYVLDEATLQGERVFLKGTLDWGGVDAISAPFCLVTRQADGDTMPVCHLLAPEITYGPHIGAVVTVEGTRWRVKGAKLPFVIPQVVRFGE